MKDRSVEYPNRYRMTLVPGTTDIYEMTPVPGEVYEEGTLMSKANILDDNSEMDIWGTLGDRTPNDAFSFIGKSLVAHDQDIANLRSDHDQDIANLTASLEGKIITGTYTGNGAASRTISLGFTPKFVLLLAGADLGDSNDSWFGGLAVTNSDSYKAFTKTPTVTLVANGFAVYYDLNASIFTNQRNVTYNYIVAT